MTFFLITLFSLILITLFTWRFLSNYYSLPCPSWLSWMVEMDNPFAKTHKASRIIEHLQIKPNMTILDMGCGPGRVTIPLAKAMRNNGEIVAMDTQMTMLERIEKKAILEKLTNIKFLHACLGENKLEKNKFDRILLVAVLGEIPNRELALKELFFSLKPGGMLSITETLFDPHYQRIKMVLSLANKLGFQEENRYGNIIAYTINLKRPLE